MYIKSMVIEGFKSYAQRTEINNFDPLFNAITGLNGSGKSNILDGICFLLGISNLSQVRAVNLNELVYKNGQGGINKATVSITFDNSNKNQSPLGYNDYNEITVTRQVAIGNRNKYLINGSNANNIRVQDLFRSVQLNVNNPHFLIMQGRITKVLNMKPNEILSMMEEATGTRLYENKKEIAQKTIEKKDAKLKEIDAVLNEEITPKLTKLKDERESYLEYQKITRELEHLHKIYIAHQFVTFENRMGELTIEIKGVQGQLERNQKDIIKNEKNIKDIIVEIADLEKKRDKESGGIINKLDAELVEKKKVMMVAESSFKAKQESLNLENKKLKELEKQVKNEISCIQKKQSEIKDLEGQLIELAEKSSKDKESLVQAQTHLKAIKAGLSINVDGQEATINQQLIAAKKTISNAETEFKQAQNKFKHFQQELKKQLGDVKNTEASYKKDQLVYNNLKSMLEKLENELKAVDYEEGTEERLMVDHKNMEVEVQRLREKVDQLEARFPNLQFNYKDPEPNFNKKSVKGLVASLFTVKDPAYALALEVVAGGKLYQVVVDTEQNGKKILEKGNLKRKVTFIPLNKITSKPIPTEIIKRAENLVGKENIKSALSLIDYNPELDAAMRYVFGGTFIASSLEIANRVAFADGIHRKTVSIEGDSFDPAGLATGGARNQSGSILLKLQELQQVKNDYQVSVEQLNKLTQQLYVVRKIASKWRDLKQQLELKSQEERLLETRLKQSTHGQKLEEIDMIKLSLTQQEEIIKTSNEEKERAEKKVVELEDKIQNADAIREKEMKQAEEGLSNAQKTFEYSIKKFKDKEQQLNTVNLEIDEMGKETFELENQIINEKAIITAIENEIILITEKVNDSKEKVEKCSAELNKLKAFVNECNKEIEEKQLELQKKLHGVKIAKLQVQEVQHKLTSHKNSSMELATQIEQMLADNSWIADERKHFNVPNSTYDFTQNNASEANNKIQKLQGAKEKLSKIVNMRAMSMLEKAEEKYNELKGKREIVLNDKAKIVSLILELDQKKNEALKQAYSQVNKDFGSIFSTLLPGAYAKLIPAEGNNILNGLEFKIGFGDVWKESLSELSGGQRSLVALSLILSLLLFKPAPLYILDEVDAALDLSHTQNIGQMLKTHFKHSQFIVVSLKDGMFNNANVLFKTKFVDGVSTVTRHIQQQNNRAPLQEKNNQKKNKT